jgi:hypothetical protein
MRLRIPANGHPLLGAAFAEGCSAWGIFISASYLERGEHRLREHRYCSDRSQQLNERPQPIVNSGLAAIRRKDGFI